MTIEELEEIELLQSSRKSYRVPREVKLHEGEVAVVKTKDLPQESVGGKKRDSNHTDPESK